MVFHKQTKLYLAIVTALLVGAAAGWVGHSVRLRQGAGVLKTLDQEQRQIFRDIRQSQRAEMMKLREQLVIRTKEFDEAVVAATSDDVLREKYSAIVELRGEMDRKMFEMAVKMRPHLRPEQQEQMRMMNEHHGGHNGHRKFGR